jgi:hypothetical protein
MDEAFAALQARGVPDRRRLVIISEGPGSRPTYAGVPAPAQLDGSDQRATVSQRSRRDVPPAR